MVDRVTGPSKGHFPKGPEPGKGLSPELKANITKTTQVAKMTTIHHFEPTGSKFTKGPEGNAKKAAIAAAKAMLKWRP